MGAPVLFLFFFLQDSIFFKFIVRLLFGINFNKLMLVPLWWGCVYSSVPEDTAQHRWVKKMGTGSGYCHHSSKHSCVLPAQPSPCLPECRKCLSPFSRGWACCCLDLYSLEGNLGLDLRGRGCCGFSRDVFQDMRPLLLAPEIALVQ